MGHLGLFLGEEMPAQYTLELSPAEAQALDAKLNAHSGYCRCDRPYATFCYEGSHVQVAYYPKKRKLLVQGSGADDFLASVLCLDPTGNAPPRGQMPAGLLDASPHFGIDESGKGDYFGPLVIAGVYSCGQTAQALLKLGCKDSKMIKDDRRIASLAANIMHLPGIAYETVCIGPRRYNELYAEMGNLNRLLAWGHARVIAALHEKVPSCPRALSDQFAHEWVLKKAVGARHIPVKLEQRTGGESDMAVAAASILARARFVRWIDDASAASGCALPLGCAPHVAKAARAFVAAHGADRLGDVAKLHFKTTAQVLP